MTRGFTIHTMETLLAKTEQVGECMEWTGCMQNGTPYIFHDGKLVSVRRLMRELQGLDASKNNYYSCRHGCKACVRPEHIMARTPSQHAAAMSKSPNRQEKLRRIRIAETTRASRSVLDIEKARAIRCSEESGPVLAQRYGVHRTVISRIRRNQCWVEYSGSPFSDLGAR